MASEKLDGELLKRRETWYESIGEMVSPEQVEVIKGMIDTDSFGSKQLEFSMDECYGTIWARDGLSRRDRSLVTLGLLVALKATPQLVYQIRMALRNGLTPREIEEVILHTMPYVGVPAADLANGVARETLKGEGVKIDNRSPEDL